MDWIEKTSVQLLPKMCLSFGHGRKFNMKREICSQRSNKIWETKSSRVKQTWEAPVLSSCVDLIHLISETPPKKKILMAK
jgi:hypothetical protein